VGGEEEGKESLGSSRLVRGEQGEGEEKVVRERELKEAEIGLEERR